MKIRALQSASTTACVIGIALVTRIVRVHL
jgi:hypothetical protein